MTIDELINEGEKFQIKHQEGYIEPAGYGMIKKVSGYSYIENADVFATWIQKCIRFLICNFPNDIAIDEFKKVEIDKLKQGTIYSLVGSLKALRDTPVICELKRPVPMNNITVNQNQTQNQSQTNNHSFVVDVLKEELRGKEFAEIDSILSSNQSKDNKKNAIITKMKSFGENVAAGIVATLLTQGIK